MLFFLKNPRIKTKKPNRNVIFQLRPFLDNSQYFLICKNFVDAIDIDILNLCGGQAVRLKLIRGVKIKALTLVKMHYGNTGCGVFERGTYA